MGKKQGPFARKLRKHLEIVLAEISDSEDGSISNEALIAELRYRYPSDYGSGMKEKGLLREVTTTRKQIESGEPKPGDAKKKNRAAAGGKKMKRPRKNADSDDDSDDSDSDSDSDDEDDELNSVAVDNDNSSSNSSSNSEMKNEKQAVQADADKAFEQAAVQHEAKVKVFEMKGASLNDSLRNNYSKQTAAAAASKVTPAKTAESVKDIENQTSGSALLKKKKRKSDMGGEGDEAALTGNGGSGIGSSNSSVKSIKLSSAVEFLSTRPKARFSDLGGMEEVVPLIRQLVELPMKHPELYQHLGISPPTGVLIHGSSGCGKSLLVDALAGELDIPYIKVIGNYKYNYQGFFLSSFSLFFFFCFFNFSNPSMFQSLSLLS
jgi:SpoVK/Ycf46/Vps4 family AAA+-type ATPase